MTHTPKMSFSAWEMTLDRICRSRLGMSLSDLPDVMTRDAYDCGESPSSFYLEEILPMVQEDLMI